VELGLSGTTFRSKPEEVLSGSMTYSSRQSEPQTACKDGLSYH